MSNAYPAILMLENLKKVDCKRSTADFIRCKIGTQQCANFDEICRRVCNGESKLHDIIIVKEPNGTLYAQDKTIEYVRHSDR